jgi:hypothetical protein
MSDLTAFAEREGSFSKKYCRLVKAYNRVQNAFLPGWSIPAIFWHEVENH